MVNQHQYNVNRNADISCFFHLNTKIDLPVYYSQLYSKAEHEYMKPVSTCGLICGKPVGIVTHRSKSLSDTGHYRSESANLKQQVLVTSTC